MRDFSLWPLQATLLQSSYKALSHRRRLQQALAAVCHWKDTNLTQGVHPVRSNLASNFSARTSSRNSSAWHVCWMPIAKSCQLSFFFFATDPCLCSFETGVKPTAHGKRHGTAKAQEAGKTSRHLQPVSAGWELWKIDVFTRYDRAVLFDCNSLSLQDSSNIKGKRVRKCLVSRAVCIGLYHFMPCLRHRSSRTLANCCCSPVRRCGSNQGNPAKQGLFRCFMMYMTLHVGM